MCVPSGAKAQSEQTITQPPSRFSCDEKNVGQGQTILKTALLQLQTGVLQAHVRYSATDSIWGREAVALACEDQPLQSHADRGAKAAFAIRDPKNQYAVWREC